MPMSRTPDYPWTEFEDYLSHADGLALIKRKNYQVLALEGTENWNGESIVVEWEPDNVRHILWMLCLIQPTQRRERPRYHIEAIHVGKIIGTYDGTTPPIPDKHYWRIHKELHKDMVVGDCPAIYLRKASCVNSTWRKKVRDYKRGLKIIERILKLFNKTERYITITSNSWNDCFMERDPNNIVTATRPSSVMQEQLFLDPKILQQPLAIQIHAISNTAYLTALSKEHGEIIVLPHGIAKMQSESIYTYMSLADFLAA